MKKMGKVAAVLVAAGMLFMGVGTAYADDATTSGATAPQTATAAPANSTDNTDVAKDAKNTKDAADAKAEADTKADKTQAAEPKTEAKPETKAAPAPQAVTAAAGPAITEVTAPTEPLLTATDADLVRPDGYKAPTFKVTLTGLTPGKGYGVISNLSSAEARKPANGSMQSTYDSYGSAVFNADSTTETVDVAYGLANTSSAWFALIESDTPATQNGTSSALYVYGSVVNVSDDYPISTIDVTKAVKVSDPTVGDIGQHTVGLKAHYSIDPQLYPQVTKICYSASVVRVLYQEGKLSEGDWQIGWRGARGAWDCETNAQDDADPNGAADYAKVMNMASNYTKSQKIMGQWYSRSHWIDGESLAAEGDITNTFVGLLAGTKYGNWGYAGGKSTEDIEMVYNLSQTQQTANDPASMMYAGLVLTFKDGTRYVPFNENTQDVPTFTTKPSETPGASGELTEANKNGVTGNGKAEAGSVYRLYVDSLKETEACKAAVAAKQYCYWTGYIYSDPVRLGSADGKASAVRVDKDGKAYVEYTIPAGYSGDHKIAVYDDSGNLLGWTPVTVGKPGDDNGNNGNSGNNNDNSGNNNGGAASSGNSNNSNKTNTANKGNKKNVKTLSNTGSAVLVVAFTGAALLIAGVSIVVYRRRQA